MTHGDYLLISGTASGELAQAIARESGMPLTPCAIERFPDGEVSVEIGVSVRRREVVLIQSTSPPVNDNLVELALLADACRRAAASHITAIVPYFGYARSDRRQGRRSPVSARAAADLLEASGIGHVVTVDVHAPQIEGFFHIPTDDISAMGPLCGALGGLAEDTVVVAPDPGAVRRARNFSRCLNRPMALCLKQRLSGAEVEVFDVVGHVAGRACIVVDDMISTGGTVAEAARALRAAGASGVSTVIATHGVFSPGAIERMAEAGVARVIVADTVAVAASASDPRIRIERVSVAPLLAAVIERLESGESLRALG
jgi:ribose-phosphate pyrophosphokinase